MGRAWLEAWLERRGTSGLLLALANGQLVWDENNRRFDPDGSTASPLALTVPGAFDEQPFYVDISEDAPWDASAPLFREKVLDLAAPMHGKPKYELASDDVREQRRFRRWRRAATLGLVGLTVTSLLQQYSQSSNATLPNGNA